MRIRTGILPGDWRDDGPSQNGEHMAALPVAARLSAIDRPERAGAIVRTAKGMLHRIGADGRMRSRCRGGRDVAGEPISEDEAWEWANRHPEALCRYGWCFRSVVVSIGINPETGHFARVKRAIA